VTKKRLRREGVLAKAREGDAVVRVTAEFDRKIESLKHPDTAARINAVVNTRGRARKRPKVGETF
jgi:hypothetical protein